MKVDPDAWITAPPKRGGLLLDGEIEGFLRADPAALELGLNWRCACCGRSIGTTLRRNAKRKLVLQPRQVRPGGGEGETVCIDCHTAMIQLAGSARAGRDDVLFEDVREVFAFRRNARHQVRSADVASAVVEQVRDRMAARQEAERAALEAHLAELEAERVAMPRILRRVPRRTAPGGLY